SRPPTPARACSGWGCHLGFTSGPPPADQPLQTNPCRPASCRPASCRHAPCTPRAAHPLPEAAAGGSYRGVLALFGWEGLGARGSAWLMQCRPGGVDEVLGREAVFAEQVLGGLGAFGVG